MRDRLLGLLVAELAVLRDRALAAGATPDQLASIIEERLCRLRGTAPRRDESGG